MMQKRPSIDAPPTFSNHSPFAQKSLSPDRHTFEVRTSNSSAVRVLTNRHTGGQTDRQTGPILLPPMMREVIIVGFDCVMYMIKKFSVWLPPDKSLTCWVLTRMLCEDFLLNHIFSEHSAWISWTSERTLFVFLLNYYHSFSLWVG